MDVTSQMKKYQWFITGIMAAVVFIVQSNESILGVDVLWAIPLAIIAAILGGLYFLRVGKLAEQRSKKFKNLAEQMGMEFSEKGDNISSGSSGFELFSTSRANITFSKSGVDITNVLYGDSEQLGYGEEFKVTILDCSRSEYSAVQERTRYTVQTVICFRSPQLSLPDFSMRPEHFFDKIGSVLGYNDIDFESHPTAAVFSKKYLLRGKDEQKIRALFTDEVLAFFAGQDKICVEGFSSHLCFYRARKLIEPEDIPAFMKEGFEVFRLFTSSQPS